MQYGYAGSSDNGVMAVRGMTIAVIPEPASALFLGLGAMGVVLLHLRRRRKKEAFHCINR